MLTNEFLISEYNRNSRKVNGDYSLQKVNDMDAFARKALRATDFWNLFWCAVKLLSPNEVELYDRRSHVLVTVRTEECISNELLKVLLGNLQSFTLVKSSFHTTDDGNYVFLPV